MTYGDEERLVRERDLRETKRDWCVGETCARLARDLRETCGKLASLRVERYSRSVRRSQSSIWMSRAFR